MNALISKGNNMIDKMFEAFVVGLGALTGIFCSHFQYLDGIILAAVPEFGFVAFFFGLLKTAVYSFVGAILAWFGKKLCDILYSKWKRWHEK